MASKKKAAPSLLNSIVEATKTAGFTHLPTTPELQALITSGHVEADPANIVDGKIAVRATALALNTPAPAPVEKPSIAIVTGLDLPTTARSVTKEEVYPFSKLEVGQSFFVAIPADKFASTVSSASRRFATRGTETKLSTRTGKQVPVLTYTKKFTGRAVKAGQKYSNGFVEAADGTRVFRTA